MMKHSLALDPRPSAPRRNVLAYHPVELFHEWETRTNRPRPRDSEAELSERWSTGPGSTRGLASGGPEPELMIVLTTFGRPALAARLLGRLRGALELSGARERAALLVLHDASAEDYGGVREAARRVCPSHLWLDARERFGKLGFWQMHQTALSAARAWRPRFALYLQDDVDEERPVGCVGDDCGHALFEPVEREAHQVRGGT